MKAEYKYSEEYNQGYVTIRDIQNKVIIHIDIIWGDPRKYQVLEGKTFYVYNLNLETISHDIIIILNDMLQDVEIIPVPF